MKSVILFQFVLLFMVITISNTYSKQKIGVYDSRMIAIMYANSDEFSSVMKEKMNEYKLAKANNDSIKAKKIESEQELQQRIFHDKGFGKGSVAEYLENNSNEIKLLAEKLGLTAIVSKWELNYYSNDVELVDITIDLLKSLNAKENVINMYDSMKSQQPVKNAFYLNPNN